MIRGRHRGLPVAVDRSILLPQDLVMQDETRADEIDATKPAQTVDKTEEWKFHKHTIS